MKKVILLRNHISYDWHNKLALFFCALLILGCRKPNEEATSTLASTHLCSYDQYTSANFDYIWSPVFNPNMVIGPFTFLLDGKLNREVVFNPSNPNEIAFVKTDLSSFAAEVWKFDFCTGESSLIVDNFSYNLDWGSNGWLLYTGDDYRIYKVKPNGDSLTVLSDLDGINSAGKWNPSGTMYWNSASSYLFKDSEGNLIHEIAVSPVHPFGWLNDTTVLGWRDNHIYSMKIPSEELSLLNNKWINDTPENAIDLDEMVCYSLYGARALVKYSLDGTNEIDTIRGLILSYSYSGINYMNNKLVTSLVRVHWKDSIQNEQYLRQNILLLNSDGTGERMMELME